MASSHDWSALPIDILALILMRLPTIDFVRCRAVCKPWRNLAHDDILCCSPAPQPPWLMLPAGNDEGTLTFFSLSSNTNLFTLRLPELHGGRSPNSTSNGYIIFLDEDATYLLILNPLTGTRISFPPIATVTNIAATFRFISETLSSEQTKAFLRSRGSVRQRPLGDMILNKVVLLLSSSAPPTVAMICGLESQLSFARAGDASWVPATACKGPSDDTPDDIIFHKGMLYALSFYGEVIAYSLGESPLAPNPMQHIQFDIDELCDDDCGAVEDYPFKLLVESSAGDLLQVWCVDYIPLVPEDWRYLMEPFVVFKLDQRSSNNKWSRVRSLGDDVLMLGRGCSMCVSARDFPELQGNCIYYALMSSHTIRVFSLEDGSIEYRQLRDPELKWPLPGWFAPSLS